MKTPPFPRVLVIQDDHDAARRIKEGLVGRGAAVRIVDKASAPAAIRDRGAYTVLCIDAAAPGAGSFAVLHALAAEGSLPPTIILMGPETAAAADQFRELGPVCALFRDAESRYINTLPWLAERLSALGTLTKENEELKKALDDAQQRLFVSQKMEAIGMLAGGIAHDFNNVLATILGYASFLRGKAAPDDIFFEGLSAIEDSAVRASELTTQLSSYSHGDKPEITAVSINQAVSEVGKIIRKGFDKSIEIRTDLGEQVGTVQADISRIKLMVLSLAINARDAMPTGGTLRIRTFILQAAGGGARAGSTIPPGRWVGIGVSNTGPGMDDETGRGILEAKENGETTAGSSLSVVTGIVSEYGGRIEVRSRAGTGTEFVVFLPASENGLDTPAAHPEELRGGDERILVIDDEMHIVQMFQKVLTDFGYRVLVAGSGAEGVGIFEEKGNEIDLVILDIIMPGMGGKEVMSRLRSLRPDIKVLLASGFSHRDIHRDLMAMGAAGFIGKPFVIRDLLKKIRDILG